MNAIKKFLILFFALYSANIMQAGCCNSGCNCTNQMFTCATSGESILYTTNSNGTAKNVICPSTICPLCKHVATDHNCPAGSNDLSRVYSSYPIVQQAACGTCSPSTVDKPKPATK